MSSTRQFDYSNKEDDHRDPSGRTTPTLSSRDTDSVDSGATNGPSVDHLRIKIPGTNQSPSPGPEGVQPQRKKRDESIGESFVNRADIGKKKLTL